MKFRNIATGAVIEPRSEMVEEQIKKNPLYQEVTEEKRKSRGKKKAEEAEPEAEPEEEKAEEAE